MTDPIITVSDTIPPYCPWGVKYWFERHGLDFRDFLQNGIPASVVLATGDAQGAEIVQRKLESLNGRRQQT